MPLRDNPRIAAAVLGTWLVTALLLSVPWLAGHLGHALPTALGAFIALLAFPAVLAADTLMKFAQRGAAGATCSERGRLTMTPLGRDSAAESERNTKLTSG